MINGISGIKHKIDTGKYAYRIRETLAGIKYAAIRLALIILLYIPYLQTQYTFDIYRYYFLYVIWGIVWKCALAFAPVAVFCFVFNISLHRTLVRTADLLLVAPFRGIFDAPPDMPRRSIKAVLRVGARIGGMFLLAFFMFGIVPLIAFQSPLRTYSIFSIILVVFPAILYPRNLLKQIIVRVIVLAPLLLISHRIFTGGHHGITHQSRFVLLVCLCLALLASNYLPLRWARGTMFLPYFFRLVKKLYTVFLIYAYIGFSIAFSALMAMNWAAIHFIYYKLWPVFLLAFVAAGILICVKAPAGRKFSSVFILLIAMQLFAQVFLYIRWMPDEERCDKVPSYSGEVAKVLTFPEMMKNKKCKGSPYDTVYDSARDRLIVTFKNRSGHGTLMLIAPDEHKVLDTINTFHADEPRRIMFPERLAIDTERQVFFSTVKSPFRYTLIKGSYAQGRLRIINRLYFNAEEISNVIYLPDRNLLGVIFVATPVPSIRFYEADNMKFIKRVLIDKQQLAEYWSYDRENGRLLLSSHSWLRSFWDPHIYTIDLNKMTIRHVKVPELMGKVRTLYGSEFDPETKRYYISSPLSHQVVVLDTKNMSVKAETPTGDHVRKLALAKRAGTLYITCYGDGAIDAMDVRTNKIIRTYRLGPLVRSATVDPVTERVFAASACGVYEIKLDKRNRFPVDRPYRLFYSEYFINVDKRFSKMFKGISKLLNQW